LDVMLSWSDREFSLFDGAIYCNGACTNLDGSLHYLFLDEQCVRIVLDTVNRYPDVHLSLHLPHDMHAFNFPLPESMYRSWALTSRTMISPNEANLTQVMKILIFHDHLTDSTYPLPSELIYSIQEQCGPLARVYVTDGGKTVQLAALHSGKLSAIESLRLTMNWKKEEIMVFGDDENDREMLSFYPHSVAMGNAHDAIKSIACHQTLSHDEDGIAYALDRWV